MVKRRGGVEGSYLVLFDVGGGVEERWGKREEGSYLVVLMQGEVWR